MKQLHIVVGLSGGVDSTVAAYLLTQQGHKIEGVYMKNWEQDDEGGDCPAAEEIAAAHQVCEKLGIPFHTVNFAKSYWDNVFKDFLVEYQAGRTPNPDIFCNKKIKFKAFLEHAKSLGADKIATGHYARLTQVNSQYQLLKARDHNKDQTYFLSRLNQAQLQHSLFPLGEIAKTEVRQIAQQAGFANYQRKDSTGICFIGERKFKPFLQQYLSDKPGNMTTPEGEVIGQHDGLMYYTIGQRQGLNIGGQKHHSEQAWYVAQKQPETNTLIVVQGHDHPLLMKQSLQAEQLHWISEQPMTDPLLCHAKIRYQQKDVACTITDIHQQGCTVIFEQPQRAITPGQAVVFYQGDQCLGGGIISG